MTIAKSKLQKIIEGIVHNQDVSFLLIINMFTFLYLKELHSNKSISACIFGIQEVKMIAGFPLCVSINQYHVT